MPEIPPGRQIRVTAEVDPARSRRPIGRLLTGEEFFLTPPTGTSFAPIQQAVREVLAEVLGLPRPGCDECGRPATYAHLDPTGQDAALACDDCDLGGYEVKLVELAKPNELDWVDHLAEKGWGLVALMRLLVRLEDEEEIRQLRLFREAKATDA